MNMLSFEIYPTVSHLPTIGEVSQEIGAICAHQLERMGVGVVANVVMQLVLEKDQTLECNFAEPLWTQKSGERFWLSLQGLHDGIAVFCDADREDILINREEICENQTLSEEIIDHALSYGREWSLRSYAGRTAVGRFLLGCSTAALARRVNGIVYSDDSEWSELRVPVFFEEFLDKYFQDSQKWRAQILEEL